MKRILIATALVSLGLGVNAETWTDAVTGYTWQYDIANYGDAKGVGILRGVKPSPQGHLVIPEIIAGIEVREIGDEAFMFFSSLTSVTIPDSVTSIGNYAFQDSGVTSVTIPDSVTNIGKQAFYSCSGLTSVTIPDSVTSIGVGAFYYCSGVTNFVVGANNPNYCSVNGLLLTKDGKTLIDGINGDVTIPDSVTNIGMQAFCRSGLTSVAIPDSVTSIGYYAFQYCSGLTSVTIGNGVKSIGDGAFYYCRGLTSVTIGNGVKSIGSNAFSGCSGLTSVAIPDSVTSIGDYAFSGCSGLTSVAIPDGVTNIDDYAFKDCSGLTSVTIGNGVTNIGTSAFAVGSGLRSVYYLGAPSKRIQNTSILSYGLQYYTRKYSAQWRALIDASRFGGFISAEPANVQIILSAIRENDPTVMDVVYKVTSSKPTVKIRALAFEDGERSFAKVVRPETFVDGTAPANWDAVEANVEHTLSWKVSSDWATRLAKVKFEVLASDGDLLPLELRTIPASDQYGKMKISWNTIQESQVFDALLWQYADKDPGLTLAGGVLSNGSTQLASGSGLSSIRGAYVSGSGYQYTYPAIEYIYSKMGYQLLTGAPLSYANSETRLGLSPDGVRQYAYKIVEE